MGNALPFVHLPKAPAKKGTVAWKIWAKAQFARLVGAGYSFTAAAETIGVTYKWWSNQTERDPEWAAEMRSLATSSQPDWEFPDMREMSFHDFLLTYAEWGYVPDHHDWIADALEDPMAKLVMILGHPESAKSTIVSLWYVLFTLMKNPDARIALVSKSSTKAQDLLTRVKRYLTEDHLYDNSERNFIQDFKGWKPQNREMEWSQDQIYVRHRKSGERDPSVQALGIGKQIYGARLDLLILDDALVMDNQISETNRDRLDQWFTNEARSRAQRGQTIVNGTRLFPMDLYGQWKKSWVGNRLFRLVTIPALQDEWTPQERPTWHQFWTLDGYDLVDEIDGQKITTGYQPGLRDIREEIMARDPSRWRLVYQQHDVEDTDTIFRQAHIDSALALGAGRRMGQVFPHEALVLGIDPAVTGRAAAVVLAVDPTTRVRTVIDIFVGSNLGATGIRQQLIYQFWEKYMDVRISATVIETNFAPTLLGDESFLQRAEAYGTRLVKHTTVGRGHKRGSKWDEEFGIAALAPLFGGGLMAFASGGPDDRRSLQPLIDDMLVFPYASSAQDAIVALWVASGEANLAHSASIAYDAAATQRGVPDVVRRRGMAGSGRLSRT
jgi:hypothetical protein